MDAAMANVVREYRKGNWTVQETMVLIEAKKMDDERRLKRHGESSSEGRSKAAELRWKWVEDYCWRNRCSRSQNQCNDKWDNLMRDFKKVRDYERRLQAVGGASGDDLVGSYWKMEKNERKEKNLPSNMLPQIYEALVEVAERKAGQRVLAGAGAGAGAGGGSSSGTNPNIPYVLEIPTSSDVHHQPSLPPLVQHSISASIAAPSMLPLPPTLPPPHPPTQPPIPYSQPLPTVDSDTSEHSDSPAKRRRRAGGEGTSGTASAGVGHGESHEVGSAISRSASIIAEAIQAGDEREERRHRELLSLHERRLQIEETKAEINRQGINSLVDAINNLANSIFSLASNKNQPTPK